MSIRAILDLAQLPLGIRLPADAGTVEEPDRRCDPSTDRADAAAPGRSPRIRLIGCVAARAIC